MGDKKGMIFMGTVHSRIVGFIYSSCLMFVLFLSSQAYAQDVVLDYAVAMGDAGSELSESIAFDSSGNIFVTADSTTETITLGSNFNNSVILDASNGVVSIGGTP